MKYLLLLLLIITSRPLWGQYRAERYDTSYYVSYRDKLTLGALFTKKSTAFKMNAPDAAHALKYLSNSPGRFGFSVGHDFINLSGTVGLGKLDPSYAAEKGTTKQLNLQLSLTGKKVLADIYFQQYRGLYLAPQPALQSQAGHFYTRPDIQTRLYGSTVTLIRNDRKFTAQAPFLLDGQQKKSAGSLLYGGEAFFGSVLADSAFIPSRLADAYPHADVRRMHFISFGPGAGYGYSLVFRQHFFITALASLNADLSYIREWDTQGAAETVWRFNPNLKGKAALGYNGPHWGLGLSYTSNRLFFKATELDGRYLNYNDNYKLLYVRRLDAGRTIPKITGWAQKLINRIGLGFLVN
ncbi:hypothetical protein GCM10027051_04800 [Niabella terrae]